LSNIFLRNYKDLKLHRPLTKYSKEKIKNYANKKKLIWFEDRSNFELEFTRNKIRRFLYKNNQFSAVNKERNLFSKISHLKSLHLNFFKKKRNKIYEIDINKFNNLNKNLKYFVIQSFYYEHRNLLKKQIRDENIRSFIKRLKPTLQNGKEISVFSGKIDVFDKKICLNLT